MYTYTIQQLNSDSSVAALKESVMKEVPKILNLASSFLINAFPFRSLDFFKGRLLD